MTKEINLKQLFEIAKDIFIYRNEKLITDTECEYLINNLVRKKIGLKNFPKGHYEKFFMPKSHITHNGNYHTVDVNIPEGHSHIIDATK